MDRSISYALEKIACLSVVLKSEQAACIQCIYKGKDVFLWLPTGFGKSLCYEVLPFIFNDKFGKHNSIVIVDSTYTHRLSSVHVRGLTMYICFL